MAKITANGDEPVRVWYGPHKRRMVWTRRGRLLMRYAGTSRYAVLRTNCSEQTAESMAASQLMSPELVAE